MRIFQTSWPVAAATTLLLACSGGGSSGGGSGGSGGSGGGAAGDSGSSLTCSGTMADCNQIASDGCEVDLQVSESNCGSCGNVCPSGACTQGHCIAAPELLAPTVVVFAMVSDGTRLHWSTSGSPAFVRSVPVTGGDVSDDATGGDKSFGIALNDNGMVFWTSAATGPDGSVWRFASGTASEMAQNQTSAFSVTADNDWLYWTNLGTYPDYLDGSVMRIALPSGAPETVATSVAAPAGIVGDATRVYWIENHVRIVSCSKAGGTPATLAVGSAIASLALDDQFLYYASGQTVHRIDKSTGTGDTVIADGYDAENLSVDGTNVYYTSWVQPTRRIMKVAKQGGTPEVVHETSCAGAEPTGCEPLALCLDDANVYFSERLNGIFRLPKTQ